MTPLDERVASLERSLRRFRFGAAAVGVVALAMVVASFARQESRAGIADVVRASRFALVESDGTERGVWSILNDGAARFILHNGDESNGMSTAISNAPSGASFVTERG